MRTQTQRCRAWWAAGAVLTVGLYGCPGDTELAKGDGADQGGGNAGGGASGSGASGSGASGSGASGSGSGAGAGSGGGSSGSGGGSAGSGSTAGSSGGAAGSGSGETCPPGTAIPAICELCADGSCGQPVCKGGVFTGDFQCAGGSGGSGGAGGGGGDSGGCVHGGCSSQLCGEAADGFIGSTCEWREEYACYQAAQCARQADGQCGFTETQALADCLDATPGSGLRWYATCGDPGCSSAQNDDPSVPNCTGDMVVGGACDSEGQACETLECGGGMVCASSDPIGLVGCPISRARYKQGIEYLDAEQLQSLHDEVTHLPLATWRYTHAPGVPRLGFIIDDIEPSAAVAGDRVDVYGYLSMAVAAIQVQQRQIEALQSELEALRDSRSEPAAQVCGP